MNLPRRRRFSNPVRLIIAVAAYFLLGETLGFRKLLGVIAGMIGALIIIRPGSSLFDPYALFPLGAALGFTGYTIITRFLSRNESVWTSFLYSTLIGCAFATLVVPFYWTTPDPKDFALMLAAGILGAAGQYLIIRALFVAEASVVAPISYASLVFAAIYGIIVFEEFVDIWTWLGACVIALSGVYVWYLDKRRREKEMQTSSNVEGG